MPELSPAELERMLKALDDVCAQAQELQRQIRDRMAENARAAHTAKSDARSSGGERKHRRG